MTDLVFDDAREVHNQHTRRPGLVCSACLAINQKLDGLTAELEVLRAALQGVRTELFTFGMGSTEDSVLGSAGESPAAFAERLYEAVVEALEPRGGAQAPEPEWLVWSVYHSGWWGPGERGYFSDLARAGRYSREQAERICAYGGARGYSADGKPSEVMVPVPAGIGAIDAGRRVKAETVRLVDEAIERFSRPLEPGVCGPRATRTSTWRTF